MSSLGTKLLNLRQHHRLSQTEIADILDVSQNAYNKWEADKCKPSANNLLKLSQHYKIDIMYLLNDNEKFNLPSPVQSPSTLMEQVFQTQRQISKLLESQFHLMEEWVRRNK